MGQVLPINERNEQGNGELSLQPLAHVRIGKTRTEKNDV